jgi:enterochelin esterase family protein
VTQDEIVFQIPDPEGAYDRVLLHHELERPRDLDFERVDGSWELRMPRPNADRLEYKLELVRDGHGEWVHDPTNPQTTPGVFGDKSVLELPEYSPPHWLEDEDAPPGRLQRLELRARGLRHPMEIHLWSSDGSDDEAELPLLVVHDGPEYAEYAALLRFLDHFVSTGELIGLRAALLQPIARDEHYSASAVYARALTQSILTQLGERVPTARRVGMGASLGGLALLHAHRTYPESFDALFLQSSSFFQPNLDAHESGFGRFRRITRFVSMVARGRDIAHPIPVTITCGTAEENFANNRALADALARQGYDIRFVANRDAHNWVGWRDTFDPHLLELLQRLGA